MGSPNLIILILGLFLAGFSVYLFLATLLKTNRDSEALSWAVGDEPIRSKSPLVNFSRPLVHQLTLQHAVRFKAPAYRKRLAKKIATAGLSGELNVDEFIGLQILWGILLPVLLVIINFALQLGYPYLLTVAIGLAGWLFPQFYIRAEKKRRYLAVIADLPFFIDLLALATMASLDIIGAINRIVEKAQDSVLADELAIVLKDIKLGRPRVEALRGLAHRLDIPEITSFIAVVTDADEMGASLAAVLKDQSVQMRVERFARAEKAGARASQALLFPLMLFILPAVMLTLFGPVVLQFIYGGGF